MPSAQEKPSNKNQGTIRISVIIALVILTVQGWTGDYANLFAAFPTSVTVSMPGLFQALSGAGALVLYHGLEGLVLLILSIIIVVLSFTTSKSRNVRIFAILGTLSIISAAAGGILFVLSSFQNNANSAQMGGSFICAYAFYFLVLYFTR
jgi:heme A synthase